MKTVGFASRRIAGSRVLARPPVQVLPVRPPVPIVQFPTALLEGWGCRILSVRAPGGFDRYYRLQTTSALLIVGWWRLAGVDLFRRAYPAVRTGPRADRAGGAHGPCRSYDELDDLVQARGLRAHLEQPLLDLGAEVDASRDLVGQPRSGLRLRRALAPFGDIDQLAVGVERLLDGLVGRELLVVLDRDAVGREVGVRLLVHPLDLQWLSARHDDAQASVVESLDDLEPDGEAADLSQALVVRMHDAERLRAGEAACDELAVARLEDMQRQHLARQ